MSVFSGANLNVGNSFTVERPVTVSTVRFSVGVSAGNIDIGLYSGSSPASITRLSSTGSFACPAAGVRTQALTAAVALVPGVRYWSVIGGNNASTTIHGTDTGVSSTMQQTAALGNREVAGTFPLPASLNLDTETSRAYILCFS